MADSIASGKIKREDIFITTKCPPSFLHPERQEAAIKDSLTKLKLDYVDLYLAHMPCAYDGAISPDKIQSNVTVEDIWKGIENLYEKKLTRSIGISNFKIEQVNRVAKVATVGIHNHQVEAQLYFQQKELMDICKCYSITMTAYAPLGSPGRKTVKLPNQS